jgi:DnaJ-class molecular chaperone
VPAETQSGRVFRLREKGCEAGARRADGDLFCRVVLETPVNLDRMSRRRCCASSTSRCIPVIAITARVSIRGWTA